MSGITAVKGLTYASGTDFADPRALRDLAASMDGLFAGYDAAFAAGPRPAAFLVRGTADGSTLSPAETGTAIGSATTEWNTTNGTISATDGTWTQDPNEAQSWYMFGGNIFDASVSGTPTAGTPLSASFLIYSYDPGTGAPLQAALGDGQPFYGPDGNPTGNTFSYFSTESTETNSAGDSWTVYAILPCYRAKVQLNWRNQDSNSLASKKTIAGTTFWGIKLGAV